MLSLFKEYGIKATEQRKEIFSLIQKLGDNATLKNIEKASFGKMDNSTIYRTIDFFLEKGIVEKNLNYDGQISYSMFEPHGHYFYCVKCHKKEKIEVCPLEEVKENLEKKGNTILNHVIRLNGICKKCSTLK